MRERTHYSLLTAHHSSLTTHRSSLTPNHSPLTTHLGVEVLKGQPLRLARVAPRGHRCERAFHGLGVASMHEVSSACWHQGRTLTLTLTTRYSYRLDGNVEHGEPEEAERVAELCRLLSTDQADARPLDLLGLRLGVGVRLRVRLGVRLRLGSGLGVGSGLGLGLGLG